MRPILIPFALVGVLLTGAAASAQEFIKAPLNHYQFAAVFEPTPGRHYVTIIHPGTGAPVHVAFTLPCGKPQVRTYPRRIIFDYGTSEIEIYFAWCGLVQVHTIPLGF